MKWNTIKGKTQDITKTMGTYGIQKIRKAMLDGHDCGAFSNRRLFGDDLVGTLRRAEPLPRNGRPPVCWWCTYIAEHGTSCLRARIRMQRAHTQMREKRSEERPTRQLNWVWTKGLKRVSRRTSIIIHSSQPIRIPAAMLMAKIRGLMAPMKRSPEML